MEWHDLEPLCQRSFYGKAKFSAENGWTYLKSYGTVVASVGPDGRGHRLSEAISATTWRHAESFFARFLANPPSSREFRKAWPLEAAKSLCVEDDV